MILLSSAALCLSASSSPIGPVFCLYRSVIIHEEEIRPWPAAALMAGGRPASKAMNAMLATEAGKGRKEGSALHAILPLLVGGREGGKARLIPL